MKNRQTDRRTLLQYLGATSFTAIAGCGEGASAEPGGSGGGSGGAGGIRGNEGGSGGTADSGGAANGGFGGSSNLSCVVRPQQTEGPYFVDEGLNRSDIRSEPSTGDVKPGVLLRLRIRVHSVKDGQCEAIPGAMVHLWQCDAQGVYSDAVDINGQFDTTGQKFLRGYQLTDADGQVEFLSIYPGWYTGRTLHLHFKVRTNPNSLNGHEFTSQLYFDESVNDAVMATKPYNERGARSTLNAQDGIFQAGGAHLIVALTQRDDEYTGRFDLGLELG